MENEKNKKVLLASLTTLLVIVLVGMYTNPSVLAQQQALTVHWQNSALLATHNVDKACVESALQDIFGPALVTLNFVEGGVANQAGHVSITFRDPVPMPGCTLAGSRTGDGLAVPPSRTGEVYIEKILNMHQARINAAPYPASARCLLVAALVAHEIAEIYLEDLAATPAGRYVMESYVHGEEQQQWDDWMAVPDWRPDNPNTPNPEPGSAELLRQRIQNDDRTYRKGEDQVMLLDPSKRLLHPGEVLVATLLGEGLITPVSMVRVTFAEMTDYTDIEGKVYFTAPEVTGTTIFDLKAWNDSLLLASVQITVSPPFGGIVVPVDKLGLLAPYIALASTIIVATVATAIYVKRVKRRKEKQ